MWRNSVYEHVFVAWVNEHVLSDEWSHIWLPLSVHLLQVGLLYSDRVKAHLLRRDKKTWEPVYSPQSSVCGSYGICRVTLSPRASVKSHFSDSFPEQPSNKSKIPWVLPLWALCCWIQLHLFHIHNQRRGWPLEYYRYTGVWQVVTITWYHSSRCQSCECWKLQVPYGPSSQRGSSL